MLPPPPPPPPPRGDGDPQGKHYALIRVKPATSATPICPPPPNLANQNLDGWAGAVAAAEREAAPELAPLGASPDELKTLLQQDATLKNKNKIQASWTTGKAQQDEHPSCPPASKQGLKLLKQLDTSRLGKALAPAPPPWRAAAMEEAEPAVSVPATATNGGDAPHVHDKAPHVDDVMPCPGGGAPAGGPEGWAWFNGWACDPKDNHWYRIRGFQPWKLDDRVVTTPEEPPLKHPREVKHEPDARKPDGHNADNTDEKEFTPQQRKVLHRLLGLQQHAVQAITGAMDTSPTTQVEQAKQKSSGKEAFLEGSALLRSAGVRHEAKAGDAAAGTAPASRMRYGKPWEQAVLDHEAIACYYCHENLATTKIEKQCAKDRYKPACVKCCKWACEGPNAFASEMSMEHFKETWDKKLLLQRAFIAARTMCTD